ncbi:MAG: Uma2 family endonuclease [Acidobacteria bacterium]|nr:Uma2 family endonuclease [Acidobacteriota bacterium]
MNLTVNDHPETVKRIPPAAGGKEVFYPCSDGKPMGETGAHVQTIITLFQILTNHFRRSDDVAVIANMMFYYVEGDPRKVISPDVFVVRNVGSHVRRVYKLWEEAAPDVVFEISSRGTRREDLNRKFQLYQQIGVKEYYVFDPEYDYLGDEPLRAFRLIDGVFVKSDVRNGRVFSPALGLELVDTGKTLRLFDRESGEFLKTYDEIDTAMDTMETNLKRVEAENDRLRAELEELKRK